MEHFNPRAPCGHDDAYLWQTIENKQFQSTCPVWGRTTVDIMRLDNRIPFQSTCPVWGRTALENIAPNGAIISIHLPRVGQDEGLLDVIDQQIVFQSTCPVWGRTLAA